LTRGGASNAGLRAAEAQGAVARERAATVLEETKPFTILCARPDMRLLVTDVRMPGNMDGLTFNKLASRFAPASRPPIGRKAHQRDVDRGILVEQLGQVAPLGRAPSDVKIGN